MLSFTHHIPHLVMGPVSSLTFKQHLGNPGLRDEKSLAEVTQLVRGAAGIPAQDYLILNVEGKGNLRAEGERWEGQVMGNNLV